MTFFGPDIRNGVAVGLGSTAGFKSRAFAPNVLFAQGEQGFWYDPSDIPVNWRRNLLTRTEEFDNAAWENATGGTGVAATVTQNAGAAPDGTTTADRLQFSLGGGATTSDLTRRRQGVVVAAQEYTYSLWVKSFDGASTYNMHLADANNQTRNVVVTGTWTRFVVTATVAAAGTNYPAIGLRGGQSPANSNTADVLVWGAQLEVGSTASDYQRIVTPEISFLDYQPQPVMYQDSAGTTPVTAVEQAVGLILDKIRGLVLGSEVVTNGGFATDTDWTKGVGVTISGGTMNFSAATSNTYQREATEDSSGKVYEYTIVVSSVSAGSIVVGLNSSPPGSADFPAITSAGTYTYRRRYTGTTAYLYLVATGFTGSIDSVSCKPVTGNHAIQPTSASRPTLRARYNLLTKTSTFEISAGNWSTFGSVSVTAGVTDPSGGTNAITLKATANGTTNQIFSQKAVPVNTSIFWAVWLRRRTGTGIVRFKNPNGTTDTDITADLTSSWKLFTVTSIPNGDGNAYPGVFVNAQNDEVDLAFPDLRRSIYAISGIPAYQSVNTATDYDTVGFPLYLAFDGVDDSLYTGGSIDFSATDKMTVWAGVTKLSDAAVAVVTELSADSGANSGVFLMYAPANPAFPDYGWRSGGTTKQTLAPITYTAPITNVLTGIGDISAPSVILRTDGVQAASNVLSQGTGNFGSYPLYIGRRNNATLPFNGRLYSLIGRGAATSAALIQQAERWVAGKQGRVI